MAKPRELAGSFEPTPESVASSSASQSRDPSQTRDGALRPRPGGTPANHGKKRSSDRYSGSTQVDGIAEQELVDQQDFAQKRQSRIRRSGGFLLESALPSIRHKVSIRGRKQREEKGKAKEKEKDNTGLLETKDGQGLRSQHGSVRSSPLSKEIKPPEHGHSPDPRNSNFRRESPDSRHSRVSTASENASNASNASDTSYDRGYRDTFDRPPPAIDPTQLVNMALSLSESRRRNYGAGPLVPTPVPNKGQVAFNTPDNSQLLQSSFYNSGVGESLKQHLQQQRRVSRNISPVAGRSSPQARHVSAHHYVPTIGPAIGLQPGLRQDIQPSDATLARVRKAAALLELNYHYRRLLQHLPPLKPDSLAPGNTRISSSGVPGTPNFQLTRTPTNANDKHPLSRQYNPLQMIRNRRMRARERRSLDPEPERFENLDHSIDWVSTVEELTSDPSYREQDAVVLPEFGPNSDDHTRIHGSGTVTGQKRPKLEWSFSPAELFADAYWLERDNNKSHIYNRHGYKIFETKRPPSAVPARLSAEFNRVERTKTSSNESQVGPTTASTPADDSDRTSDRGRKRRLFLGEKRGGRARSKDSSGLSSSENEDSEKGNGVLARAGTDGFNTGPLQGYLNNLIQEEHADDSPTVDSPDHWGTGHVSLTGKVVPPSEVVSGNTSGLNGSVTGTVKKKPTPIKAPIAARDFEDDGLRSSLDELSSVPNSPGFGRFSPRGSLELARSSIRGISPKKTPGKSKLGMRPDIRDGSQNTESYESAPEINDASKSRQASGEHHTPDSSTSSKLASNIGVKHLFSHRWNESRSSVLDRSDTRLRNENRDSKEFKEPDSAVTRFFKGVKHEGSKVGDRIFGKDNAGEDSECSSSSENSDVSESEDGPRNRLKKRPALGRRTTTTDTLGSIGITKPYRTKHLKLPTFRSTHAPPEIDTASTAGDDTDAQSSDRRGRRLPQLDLRKLSSKTPSGTIQRADETDNSLLDPLSDLERTRSHSAARNRLTNVLDRPGSFGHGGRPVTSLARLSPSPSRTLNMSRQSMQGSRHWSISDCKGSQAIPKGSPTTPEEVTAADIARTRALLLCTGIKAREIARRAHLVRDKPAPFLLHAFDAAGLDSTHRWRVPRQEEHVLAARILSQQLTSSTSQLRAATEHFRDITVADYHAQLQELRSLLFSSLEPQIKTCVEDAETYASRLSRVYPLETKTVYERAGVMLRARRRRGRWIRRGGWALVEYMLLGFMWWVWLVVSVLRMFRAVGVGAVRAVRWVLWLP